MNLLLRTMAVLGSLYAPHVFPERGPFFEGWYSRITPASFDGPSVGFIFGLSKPRPLHTHPITPPQRAYISIMRSGGANGSMKATNCFPPAVRITSDGLPPHEDPDFESPPNFTWSAEGIRFTVRGDETRASLRCGSVSLTFKSSQPRPWALHGLGPAGELDRLPLPLHWFVYSLGSTASYTYADAATGESLVGSGVAHQEKNWGTAFPQRWTWAQAVGAGGLAFAATGGPLTLWGLPVVSHFVGYRNPSKGIAFNAAPTSANVSVHADGCAGTLRLVAMLHKDAELDSDEAASSAAPIRLEANLSTDTRALSTCLLGPSEEGFVPMCVESYVTTVSVIVTSRSGGVVDDATLTSGALEFGGDDVCAARNPCTQTHLRRSEERTGGVIMTDT